MRSEFVLAVRGTVRRRPAGMENPSLATGEIEVVASELVVENPAKPLPFEIRDDLEANEFARLKYRYLDLRRPRMQRNIVLRHRAVKLIRDFLDEHGFLEIETPILTKTTPEGARDYLVPSRVHPGKFYALPQSPQQFKQLLMVAGFDRYFQIARCFRDEDLRADRQPEFTQLDVEMSFVDQEDVIDLISGLCRELVAQLTEAEPPSLPFPRLSYAEAMARYGSDKPDIRFGLELQDLGDLLAGTGVGFLKAALEAGNVVKAVRAPGMAAAERHQAAASRSRPTRRWSRSTAPRGWPGWITLPKARPSRRSPSSSARRAGRDRRALRRPSRATWSSSSPTRPRS